MEELRAVGPFVRSLHDRDSSIWGSMLGFRRLGLPLKFLQR